MPAERKIITEVFDRLDRHSPGFRRRSLHAKGIAFAFVVAKSAEELEIAGLDKEIEIYREFHGFYGYVFYLMQKPQSGAKG